MPSGVVGTGHWVRPPGPGIGGLGPPGTEPGDYWLEDSTLTVLPSLSGSPKPGYVNPAVSNGDPNGYLPIIFGRRRIKAPILISHDYTADGSPEFWQCIVILGEGQISSIGRVWCNGQEIVNAGNPGFGWALYPGSPAGETCAYGFPTVPPPDTAYLNIQIHAGSAPLLGTYPHWGWLVPGGGAPSFEVEVYGRLLFDPRDGGQSFATPSTWLYSDNVPLAIRDILANPRWKLAYPAINDTSFSAAATICDSMVGSPSAKRFTCNDLILQPADAGQHLAQLLLACNGELYMSPDGVALFIDVENAGSPVMTLDTARNFLGTKFESLTAKDSPTQIVATYSNIALDFADDTIRIPATLGSGIEPREATYNFGAMTDVTHVTRAAAYILNQNTVTPVRGSGQVSQAGIVLNRGDKVAVTTSDGPSAAPFLVTDAELLPDGGHNVSLRQYDASVYTDAAIDTSVPVVTVPYVPGPVVVVAGGGGTTLAPPPPPSPYASPSPIVVPPSDVVTGAGGEIQLRELAANGTNVTGFGAPDSLAADIRYILPDTPPTLTGQVLSWDSTADGRVKTKWDPPNIEKLKIETPAGTIDGSNRIFTLSETPVSGEVLLISDKMPLEEGIGYGRSGLVMTIVATENAPQKSIKAIYSSGGSGFTATWPSGAAGGGTVTSVGLTVPADLLAASGSPITGSGVLGLTLPVRAPNLIFAGPGSGASAAPNFRLLVPDDIPVLDTSKITSGIFPYARGGTGASTAWTPGSIIFAGASAFSQDANLSWDNTNKRLGLGPLATLPVGRLFVSASGLYTGIADFPSTAGLTVGYYTGGTGYGVAIGANASQPAIQAFDTGPVPYRLAINPYGGNVGIGIATPLAPFHLVGDARIDGSLTFVGARSISTTSDNLTLSPAADLDLTPGGTARVRATSGVRLQSDNYASQTTGWGVSYAGAGDFRYLYADELHAKSFIADLEQALAGGQIISKSVAPLAAAFTVPAASGTATLVVESFKGFDTFRVFVDGDMVRLRQFDRTGTSLNITNCWGTVVWVSTDTTAKSQTYTFTRSASPNAGAATTSSTIGAGTLALDYGTSGNGFLESNAIDGAMAEYAPYHQIVSWTTHPNSGLTVRTRLGNLKGIFNVSNEYGLYAGSGITDASQYLRISDQAVEGHNLTIKLYDGAVNTVLLSPSAPSFAMGSTLPTAYGTGTGIWMGKDGSVYKSRCGVPGGQGWWWDGTNFNINGSVTITGISGLNYAAAATPGGAASTLAGQGALATLSAADFATQVSGAQKPANNATVGATWGTTGNISSFPATLGTPSGAGLFLSSTYMGYYAASAWKTYIDSSGNMILGDPAGTAGLSWNQATAALTIKGSITLVNTIPAGSVSGLAATATSSDFAGVTGTTKPANNATVGATWGTNISGLPGGAAALVTTPSGAGLFLSSTYMGYYAAGNWKTYIDYFGDMFCGDPAGAQGLSWNQTTGVLTIKGVINITAGGNAATTAYADLKALKNLSDTSVNWAAGSTLGGNAVDTTSVNGVAAATVQGGAARANIGLSATGGPLLPVVAAPSGTGLFLGSDKLGFYAASAWKTYMDSSGHFYLVGSGANALSWDGAVLAINGAITATSGTIGGLTITANELYAGTGATRVEMQAAGGFWAGSDYASTAPFSVDSAGVLKATSGTLGGFTIGATSLTAGSGASIVAGNVTLGSAGIFIPSAGASAANGYNITVSGAAVGGLYGYGGTIYVGMLSGARAEFATSYCQITGYVTATGGVTTDGFTDPGVGYFRSGNGYKVGATQVVGGQGAAIANATNATDVITRVNALLTHFRGWGSIAT